jgi:CheY-like chemotaxis protein
MSTPLRILYVEDHAVFAAMATRAFLSECEVTVVPGIDAARRCLDTGGRPFDLVLCDFDLEDGKGDTLVGEIACRYPCIAVSAHERGNAALLAAGCVAVCGKLGFAGLRATIAAAMQNRG